MFTGTVTCAGLRAEIFHAAGSEHANQDLWLAQSHGTVLRVAALDGVTPWRAPRYPGADAAQWAVATTMGALALALSPDAALRHANDLVYRPEVTPSRSRAMAAAAVADCRLVGGRVGWSAVVSADCEVWVADTRASVPRRVLGGNFIRPDIQRAWAEQTNARNAAWSLDERLAAEADLLDDPATQLRHAIGRYPAPVFDLAEGVSRVVLLATDGSRLDEAVQHGVNVSDLATWLHDVEGSPCRDDLTCLVVEVAP